MTKPLWSVDAVAEHDIPAIAVNPQGPRYFGERRIRDRSNHGGRRTRLDCRRSHFAGGLSDRP